MRLEGIRAAVTGAGSGIGLATTQLMVQEGATVAALDLKPPSGSDSVVPIEADVTDGASMQRAADAVAEKLGGLDVLVCNAGIGSVGTVEENDDAEWHRVYDVNVVGIVRTAKAFL